MKTILDLIDLIDVVEQSVSEYNIKNLMETVAVLVEAIFNILPKIDERYIENINNILKNTNVALTNKDYLLYQDILEFELRPLLKTMVKD